MKEKKPTVHYLELDANWPSCGLRKWILSTHIVERVTCKNCQRWIRCDREKDLSE